MYLPQVTRNLTLAFLAAALAGEGIAAGYHDEDPVPHTTRKEEVMRKNQETAESQLESIGNRTFTLKGAGEPRYVRIKI